MGMYPPKAYWKAADCTNMDLLKAHVTVTPPTDKQPYYKVSMTKKQTGCTISIAVTKPLPDPLLAVHALKPEPTEWVTVEHSEEDCLCAWYAYRETHLFDVWQTLHARLRRINADHAASAFYPEHEYELGEALGHAALVLNLAMGGAIPCCYIYLVEKLGAAMLIVEVDNRKGRYIDIDCEPIDVFDC